MKNKKRNKNFKKDRGKIFKIIILAIFLISLLIICYEFVIRQVNELKKLEFSDRRVDQLLSIDRDPEYKSDEIFNLLITVEFNDSSKDQIDGFVVLQVNPNAQAATIISIHPDIYMYSQVYCLNIEERDLVRIKDLFVVGELQTPPKSCSYTLYSIEEMLALPIDGYLYVNEESLDKFIGLGNGVNPGVLLEDINSYEDWSEEWNNYWIDFFDSVSLLRIWRNRNVISSLESNMPVTDMYSLISDFKSVRNDEITSIYIEDDELEEIVNNRGDIVNLVTKDSWDEVLGEYLVDELVDREQARIEIFNGSMINGLGSRYERWIDHLGVDVIRVQNAPGEWEETTIYVTDLDDFAYTLSKIKKLWGEDIKIIEGRPDFITTGDIIIVVGLDFSGG